MRGGDEEEDGYGEGDGTEMGRRSGWIWSMGWSRDGVGMEYRMEKGNEKGTEKGMEMG